MLVDTEDDGGLLTRLAALAAVELGLLCDDEQVEVVPSEDDEPYQFKTAHIFMHEGRPCRSPASARQVVVPDQVVESIEPTSCKPKEKNEKKRQDGVKQGKLKPYQEAENKLALEQRNLDKFKQAAADLGLPCDDDHCKVEVHWRRDFAHPQHRTTYTYTYGGKTWRGLGWSVHRLFRHVMRSINPQQQQQQQPHQQPAAAQGKKRSHSQREEEEEEGEEGEDEGWQDTREKEGEGEEEWQEEGLGPPQRKRCPPKRLLDNGGAASAQQHTQLHSSLLPSTPHQYMERGGAHAMMLAARQHKEQRGSVATQEQQHLARLKQGAAEVGLPCGDQHCKVELQPRKDKPGHKVVLCYTYDGTTWRDTQLPRLLDRACLEYDESVSTLLHWAVNSYSSSSQAGTASQPVNNAGGIKAARQGAAGREREGAGQQQVGSSSHHQQVSSGSGRPSSSDGSGLAAAAAAAAAGQNLLTTSQQQLPRRPLQPAG